MASVIHSVRAGPRCRAIVPMQHRAEDTLMDHADIRKTARLLVDLRNEMVDPKVFFGAIGMAKAVASAQFPERL